MQATLPNTAAWLALASREESFEEIIRARLTLQPNDVLTLRAEQDYAQPDCARPCASATARRRARNRTTSISSTSPRAASRMKHNASRRSPISTPKHRSNGWVAFAHGYTYAEHAHWSDALAPLDTARKQLPAMRERVALDTMRVRRMLDARLANRRARTSSASRTR